VQFALRSFQALATERLRAERLERLSSEARLAQLTQQMQPHFLYNALNTIASLVHDDADAADAALLRLSHLLRAATDAARRPLHPLADELALAHSYAELMQQRFGPARVQLHWDTDAAPAIDLQPLLEDAFVHAVEPRATLTMVRISARREGERVVISVAGRRRWRTPRGPGRARPWRRPGQPARTPARAARHGRVVDAAAARRRRQHRRAGSARASGKLGATH
jgi:two-component system LytT family sensor kinase